MKKLLIAALVAGVLTACQQVSTTNGGSVGVNRKQSMSSLLSAQQVDEMSAESYNDALNKARKAGKLNTDAKMVGRVRAIADRVVPQTAVYRPDALQWKWEVNVEQSDQLNAYCMAGGKIMFYSGIITKLKLTDDEIAQIMGHEIAHALREHARERMSSEYNKQLAFTGLSLGISILTGKNYDDYLKLANQVTDVAYSLPNSREHESEADTIGLELAARAGYNPQASVTLWQKMAAAGGGAPPEFLSTHPSSQTRIRDLQAKIPAVQPLYDAASKPTTKKPSKS
ncbi:M48 family metallopeptidase [Chitinolyticbacter meiyuanensis]|uniref:M48 family metallopeptidase n=1 Tax=Chitinolyticbacter meiyuanensis TaxID=682798 RepID=UPI0011E5B745|nr:M48 family metallopeptidase [Chitinolyticbacter meiyuanensis]